MPSKSRDKGNRFERLIVNLLKDAGFNARRVPLSGADKNYKGDVIVPVWGKEYRLELKKRKDGFKQLYQWIEGNDALVVAADNKEPLLVVRLCDLL